MKYLLTLLFILSLVSCSTSQKRSKHYSDVTNEDFKKVSTIPYKRADDILKGVESKFSTALNSESLHRIYRYDGDFDGKGHLGQVASLCYQEKFKEAYAIVQNHSRSYIKNPIFWNHVGNCFLLEKKFRKALLFYNRALSLKSDYTPALNNLGVMYLLKKDKTRALVAFKRAKRFQKFSKTPKYNLANLYLSYGQYDFAIQNLKGLASKSTTDVDVLNMMATAYLMKGDYKKSLNYFQKISSSEQERVDIGSNYALALYLDNNKEEARSVINDINLDGNKSWKEYYLFLKNKIGASK